jgi:hypothetical protein
MQQAGPCVSLLAGFRLAWTAGVGTRASSVSHRYRYCIHCRLSPSGVVQVCLHCRCAVPAAHAKPCCRICSGCSTLACACIAPPVGVLLFVWVRHCYSCIPHPVPVVFLCCALLVCICSLVQLWVCLRFVVCGSFFACLRLLIGEGKAPGATQPGL